MPDDPLSIILSWIQKPNDPDEEHLLRHPIHGLENHDQTQLARLGAMVREDVDGFVPTALINALELTRPLSTTPAVRHAFNRLLNNSTENTVTSLAELYAAIVKPIDRRPLGTFFTPQRYAMSIVTGFAERYTEPAKVVDVGAGVGVFSQAARFTWPHATIHAIDINPLTLGLQGSAIKRSGWQGIHLDLSDYPSWLFSRAWCKLDSAETADPILYLGNPPYTRWQLLDQGKRQCLVAATRGLVGPRANLSTLFFAMTLTRLRSVDSLAMIIPAGWMRADYGANLRAWLRTQHERPVRLRLADSWRFEEAVVNTVLVEVGPATRAPHRLIQVLDWAGSEALEVDRRDAAAAFPAPGWDNLHVTDAFSCGERLGRLAHVTRGTASGANAFFVKSPDDWERLGIPSRFRRPLARRLRPGRNPNCPLLERAEILVLGDYTLGEDEVVDSLIRAAEEAGYNSWHLCAQRSRWFDLSSEVRTPDVILSALTRETFHVVENDDRLAILNNLFGMYWLPDCVEEKRRSLLRWLRSRSGQRALRASASVEAHGLYRLSPTAVEAIVLDRITDAEVDVSLLVADRSYEHV